MRTGCHLPWPAGLVGTHALMCCALGGSFRTLLWHTFPCALSHSCHLELSTGCASPSSRARKSRSDPAAQKRSRNLCQLVGTAHILGVLTTPCQSRAGSARRTALPPHTMAQWVLMGWRWLAPVEVASTASVLARSSPTTLRPILRTLTAGSCPDVWPTQTSSCAGVRINERRRTTCRSDAGRTALPL